MSGAMENRAAVFSSTPQDVEVYGAGAWWPGSLLGWRHEPDGACQVWVRAVVDGVERTAWTDLVDVRLPERPSLRSVPAEATPAGAPAADPGRDALTSTISLFAVRDGAPQDPAAAGAGAGGRRTGRRRAPETADVPSWAAAARGEPGTAAPSGRHRAPAADAEVAGRHRAADTGVLPAVRDDDEPAGGARPTPTPRRAHRTSTGSPAPAETSGRVLPVVPEMPGASDDGEFHTRPLRLATSVPQPRTPHWDR